MPAIYHIEGTPEELESVIKIEGVALINGEAHMGAIDVEPDGLAAEDELIFFCEEQGILCDEV
jgi:hypothetical protein